MQWRCMSPKEKKNWGGGWKEKAKMSALMLPIDATLHVQVAPGQWRFGRYAFFLKHGALFPEGFMQT